jgi:hypothetical protein
LTDSKLTVLYHSYFTILNIKTEATNQNNVDIISLF